jgi:hypothetical protein
MRYNLDSEECHLMGFLRSEALVRRLQSPSRRFSFLNHDHLFSRFTSFMPYALSAPNSVVPLKSGAALLIPVHWILPLSSPSQ